MQKNILKCPNNCNCVIFFQFCGNHFEQTSISITSFFLLFHMWSKFACTSCTNLSLSWMNSCGLFLSCLSRKSLFRLFQKLIQHWLNISHRALYCNYLGKIKPFLKTQSPGTWPDHFGSSEYWKNNFTNAIDCNWTKWKGLLLDHSLSNISSNYCNHTHQRLLTRNYQKNFLLQ